MSDASQSAALRRSPVPGPRVFWDYHDLVLFGGALLPSLLLAGTVTGITRRLFDVEKGVESFILQFVAYGSWFLALYFIFRLRHQQPFWESLAWNPSAGSLARAFVAGLAVAVGLICISAFLEKPPGVSPMQELLGRESTLILIGVFSTTLGPLCEELAFRGFLMPLLAQTFGVTVGIVLAAVPFALAHAPQYAYSWRHVALIGIAGVAFGWARFRTGSTASATAMHAAYNFTIFAGLLYEKYQW